MNSCLRSWDYYFMTSYKSHSEEYIDYIKQTLYPLLYQGKARTYTVCTFNIYLFISFIEYLFFTGGKFFPSDKSKRRKSCQLLEYVLDCIQKCCLYDTQGFINKERFDLLMQPLVDQVSMLEDMFMYYETKERCEP